MTGPPVCSTTIVFGLAAATAEMMLSGLVGDAVQLVNASQLPLVSDRVDRSTPSVFASAAKMTATSALLAAALASAMLSPLV